MNKKTFCIITALVLFFAISGIIYYNTFIYKSNVTVQEDTDGVIVEISVDAVKGITGRDAEELCYRVMGEKDKETGFIFSFGTSGAIQKGKKQYYTVRASWLVNNSHMSYIGDFFVSSDGKEIYSGTALQGEYEMVNKIWSE